MSDLQMALSNKNANTVIPVPLKADDSKSPTKTRITPAATQSQSTDSSNDQPNFQLQQLFPSSENRAVYHVLKVIGFKGPWIRFLM